MFRDSVVRILYFYHLSLYGDDREGLRDVLVAM